MTAKGATASNERNAACADYGNSAKAGIRLGAAAPHSLVRDAVLQSHLVCAAGPRLQALEQEERLVRGGLVRVAMRDEAVLELGFGAGGDLPPDRSPQTWVRCRCDRDR